MKEAAHEQIEYQKGGNEKGEEDLLEEYASRLSMPRVAYLRGDGFKDEFQENGLINGFTHEALSNCIYAGIQGTAEEITPGFICQVSPCPCRQMMRYTRGSREIPDNGYWNPKKIVLRLDLVALQRDVLKEGMVQIRFEPGVEKEREEELSEIRTQIQIIDSKWSRCRLRGQLDVRQRPLISSDEWRKLSQKDD